MEKMTLCFLRLMEIITNKNNCFHHYEPLRKLVHNFNVVYGYEEDGCLKREADILTYSLQTKLKMIQDGKLGRS